MQYVNVLLWVLMIVLITAVLCTGIAILWVETQRERWFDEGRVFEREEKELKFKRTKGTRRVKRDKQDIESLLIRPLTDPIHNWAEEIHKKSPKFMVKKLKQKRGKK